MAEQNIRSKLVNQLRNDKIQLWTPPYTTDDGVGLEQMHELAEKYAPLVGVPLLDVEEALETLRSEAVHRGSGNKLFKDTCVATLEIILPREHRQDNRRNYIETRLDVLVQDLMNRITEKYGLEYIRLIAGGRNLVPDKRLNDQNVKNNSKVMVMKVPKPEEMKSMVVDEGRRRLQEESMRRTQKGFQILSERDGSEDPTTTPFLEIADQKGNPLTIPPKERKALILAMGLHEKGRAMMKRKQHEAALCHLLQADEEFNKCGSVLLNTVDNYAVLQLDIVWCYQALKSSDCLQDSKQRLDRAEECFLKCYGEEQQRLRQIKGSSGGEDVLFLRLYLLQSLHAYLEGNDRLARQKLLKVDKLYEKLRLDTDKLNVLMGMGFTDQEARLGLRACHGNLSSAAEHISQRRKEKEEMRQREREKRRQRVQAINTLVELGFGKRDASRALHKTHGDVDRAYEILLDASQAMDMASISPSEPDKQSKLDQLAYLGFDREEVEAALRLTDWEVTQATQLLLENQGTLPPELVSPSPPSTSSPSTSSPSEEPSTSSESTGTASLDADLVNEVLEDIPQHEEDYLDLTLDEESEVIALLRSYLDKGNATTC